MTPRAEYLVKILNTIGAPLMRSLTLSMDTDETDIDTAKKMAELLGRTVKLSIDIGQSTQFNAPADDEHDDSLRVALAALAGPIIAEHYKNTKTVPSDEDISKIKEGLNAVLSFSENFSEENGAVEKLDNMDAQKTDIHKSLASVHAALPIINAVNAFSFDQEHAKLIAEIGSTLKTRAQNFAKRFDGEEAPLSAHDHIGILQTLSNIYASSHAKIGKNLSDGDKGGEEYLKAVWADFDTQLAMLETLTDAIEGKTIPAAAPTPTAAPEQSAQPPATEQIKTTEEPTKTAEKPAETKNTAPANPMGFFTPGGASNDKPADESAPVAAAEAPQAPVAPPTNTAPPALPDTETVTQDKPADDNKDESSDDGNAGGGGNPMSFFSAPPKSDD